MTTYASVADVIAGLQALPVAQLVAAYQALAANASVTPDPSAAAVQTGYQDLVNGLSSLSTTLTAQIAAENAALALAQQQRDAAKAALVKATQPIAAGGQAPPGTVTRGAAAGIAAVAVAVGAIGGYWWADRKKAMNNPVKEAQAEVEATAPAQAPRRRRVK